MDYEKLQKKAMQREKAGKVLIYFFLLLWALVVLFPFYWMVLTSIKSYGAYNGEHIPAFFTLIPHWKIIGQPLRRCPWQVIF